MNREGPSAGLAGGWGGGRTSPHARNGIQTQEQEQVLRRRVHHSPDSHLLSGSGWNVLATRRGRVFAGPRPGGRAGAARVRRVRGRPGRRLGWGLLTALLLVPTLAGAIIAVGASLAVQTLNETGFRVCLALALYGVAPTITLAAVLVLARAQRGRVFLAGLALGAGLLVPAGIALASLVG